MNELNGKLIAAVEAYFTGLRQVRGSGGATGERSYYPALKNLLDAIGRTLSPKVFCVPEVADQGAGHPDFALYTARQVQRGRPLQGQVPERGVVEVKAVEDDAWLTARSDQVSRYLGRYRLVLVTNLRDLVLVGEDSAGEFTKLGTLRLAADAEDFWRKLDSPRAFAREVGSSLGEYLIRALSHRAALTEPVDLARLLASYARDGLARVDAAGDVPSLVAVRSALEEALGIRFEGERGDHFFRSTLVQTLFYGVFSAWVLWSRAEQQRNGPLFDGQYKPKRFRWREADWHLRTPVLRVLFRQLADPGQLKPFDLVEVLDWTAAALDRVDPQAFFSRFDEGEAVQYFYEPFLEAFDPELRKELGVWYTPVDVVRYMVARVDRALKDDLSIPDGLASDNVYVLDPCCGTGAYVAEVLRRIARNVEEQGSGALVGEAVRRAATERVFGFEIMPAPFVVAHLQVGLTLEGLDAPLAQDGSERAGVFLTNALAGWEPQSRKPLPFVELEEERDRAETVKRDTPILVVLGNPPYNGFAGVAVGDEERELTTAYRTTVRVQEPQGQGLNDLYVRFFRMAERRIVEKTGQGVVCFISNYSWLDGLSFTGMRERYLEVFDRVRIDCLNGDAYRSNRAPDGSPDPSIFSTDASVGIKVGTAIATLVRRADHGPAETVEFRHLWGRSKAEELASSAEEKPEALYSVVEPSLPLGLPFVETRADPDWFDWPSLPDLFPVSFPGVKTSRDGFLVDTDLERLRVRVCDYFDPALGHGEIARRYPRVMKGTARYDARAVRDHLLKRGGPDESGFIRFAYRPFDVRWLYWEAETELLDRKRADYRPHVFEGNVWIEARQREAMETFSRGTLVRDLADNFGNGLSSYFPIWLREEGLAVSNGIERRANLTAQAERYLADLGLSVEDLFHHVLATLHDPVYREANAGALRMEWPRIPLPGWPKGHARHAEALANSAAKGRDLAALLDSGTAVTGVTRAPLKPEIAAIAVPSTRRGRNMLGDDFAVTAGWGHNGSGHAVMSGRGRAVERAYVADELRAMSDAASALGRATLDVHLNEEAFWRNVPAAVWNYRLGGYQVLKKWLSYRERAILGRNLQADEVQHFADTARRIAQLLLGSSSDHSS